MDFSQPHSSRGQDSPKAGHKCADLPQWDFVTSLKPMKQSVPRRNKETFELIEHPVAKGPIFKLKGYNAVEEVQKWAQEQYRNRARQRSARIRREMETRLKTESTTTRQRTSFGGADDESDEDSLDMTSSPARRRKRTFAWYSRVVKAVCRLSLDMKQLSVKRTQQTGWAQMYYINVSGTPPEDEANLALFFDKDLYSRKRALHKVPLWAQAVMVKKSGERTPREVRRLHKLLSNMRSFKEKFTESMRLKMCEVVRYTKCDQGRIVLRQGQAGHDFYFIFSGSVFVQIDVPDRQSGKLVTHTENVIRSGESFGEIALLGDGNRSATVICREPTELLQIDKETFLEVCPDVFTAELNNKIEFAKRFDIFKGWEEEHIKQLCFLSQVLYVPHGRLIEADWTQANFVYFVIKGRISLLLEFDVSAVQEDDDVKLEGMLGRPVDLHGMIDKDHFKYPKRLARVGCLTEGDSSELNILALAPPSDMAPARMVSEGVQVLRVAIRAFQRLGPKRGVEEYLKKDYKTKKLPSASKLRKRWLRDTQWSCFKQQLLAWRLLEGAGQCGISHVPATWKGSSGWARWPGFDLQAPSRCSRLSLKWERSQTDSFLVVDPDAPELQPRFKTAEVEKAREKAARERRRGPPPPEVVVDTGQPRVLFHNDSSMVLKPASATRHPAHLRRSTSSVT